MIRVRVFADGFPCVDLDVTTGANRIAANDAAYRAAQFGWENVQMDFGDGSRPMRGGELAAWVSRHFPRELESALRDHAEALLADDTDERRDVA